jgi:hypothetical protein
MSYRNDDDAATFRAERLEVELAHTKARLAQVAADLAAEIRIRPKATNVALEAMAIVGTIFGLISTVAYLASIHGTNL